MLTFFFQNKRMTLDWEGYNDIESDFDAYAETILMSIECLIMISLIIIYVWDFEVHGCALS